MIVLILFSEKFCFHFLSKRFLGRDFFGDDQNSHCRNRFSSHLFLEYSEEQSYSWIVVVASASVVEIVTPLDYHVLHTKPSLKILVEELAQVLTLSVGLLQTRSKVKVIYFTSRTVGSGRSISRAWNSCF